MTRPTVTQTHVAWNVKVGRGLSLRGRRRVGSEIRDLDVGTTLSLLECGGNVSAIRAGIRGRYDRKVAGSGPEGGSTRLYVHRDARLLSGGLLTTRTPWRGPKGGPHRGRVFPWALVEHHGQRQYVVAVHMPWNPRRNRRAWNACIRLLLDFAAQHTDHPVVMVGDWNIPPWRKGTGTIHALAGRVGGQIVRTDDALMYAVVIPAIGQQVAASGVKGPRGGSDHPPVTIRVKESA